MLGFLLSSYIWVWSSQGYHQQLLTLSSWFPLCVCVGDFCLHRNNICKRRGQQELFFLDIVICRGNHGRQQPQIYWKIAHRNQVLHYWNNTKRAASEHYSVKQKYTAVLRIKQTIYIQSFPMQWILRQLYLKGPSTQPFIT